MLKVTTFVEPSQIASLGYPVPELVITRVEPLVFADLLAMFHFFHVMLHAHIACLCIQVRLDYACKSMLMTSMVPLQLWMTFCVCTAPVSLCTNFTIARVKYQTLSHEKRYSLACGYAGHLSFLMRCSKFLNL